jgi:hypothetical protein
MVRRFVFGGFFDDTLTVECGSRKETLKPDPKRKVLRLPWSKYHPNSRCVRLDFERANVKDYAAKIKQVL